VPLPPLHLPPPGSCRWCSAPCPSCPVLTCGFVCCMAHLLQHGTFGLLKCQIRRRQKGKLAAEEKKAGNAMENENWSLVRQHWRTVMPRVVCFIHRRPWQAAAARGWQRAKWAAPQLPGPAPVAGQGEGAAVAMRAPRGAAGRAWAATGMLPLPLLLLPRPPPAQQALAPEAGWSGSLAAPSCWFCGMHGSRRRRRRRGCCCCRCHSCCRCQKQEQLLQLLHLQLPTVGVLQRGCCCCLRGCCRGCC
jgi:hypothetical protein